MANLPKCVSCGGLGELSAENGPYACPDCGGTGQLPSRATLVEWRARDLDKALVAGRALEAADGRWLLAELRAAREALTEVITLADELGGPDAVARRIRFAANRALGLYETSEAGPDAGS